MNTCFMIRSIKLIYKPLKEAQRGRIYYSSSLIFNKTHGIPTMNKINELEQEIKLLENKVLGLVDKLESRKKSIEAKVPKDLIIKSKEECNAISNFEQLSIDGKASKQSNSPQPTNVDKSQSEKAPKQKKGGKETPGIEKPIDVSRLDLRIGRILEVSLHPDADALYVEKIDCGDTTGPRTVISGLVKHVPIDEMKNKHVVVLCNLKPAKMRGILSEAMVMCASTPDKVELVKAPDNVKPGDRVVFDKYPGEPDTQLNPKKKIWEQIAPDIKTNENGVAMYKDCEFKVLGVEGQFTSNLKNVQVK